ncbi:hypothetical protein B0H14DRAFT_2583013 [Mycena olivaceomarginata]|nr:hypothetical protein B0H14DRAFT_2583013 [Mycena olivaceomarginata]
MCPDLDSPSYNNYGLSLMQELHRMSLHGGGIPQDNNIDISDSDSNLDFSLLPVSPIPGLTSSYTKYESAPTSVSFSRGFVSALTVNQCIALDIPTILPAGSVHVVGWSKVIPDNPLFIVGDGGVQCKLVTLAGNGPKLLKMANLQAPVVNDRGETLGKVPSQKHTPNTAQEVKEKCEASQETQAAIDAEVVDFMTYAMTKAATLGKHFDKSTRYFLDMFFQGGAHLVNHQEKINLFNAFTKLTVQRGGSWAQGPGFTETKDKILKAHRDTPRACIRNVSNTVCNIQMLMHGLSYCVGIEGFFCIVRNNPNFHMIPQWYFTSTELEHYMPLAVRCTAEVGCRLEAFAIIDCNTMNFLRTNKQKVEFLKAEIWDSVHSGLITITGRPTIQMNYPLECFVNPSGLSSSLLIFTQVRDALKDETWKWVKLSAAEHKACKAKWVSDIAAGKVVECARASCCDTGKKHKAAALEDQEEDEEMEQEPIDDNRSPVNADGPIIEEPEENAAEPSQSAPLLAKRRRTSGVTKSQTASTKTATNPKPLKKAVPKAKTSVHKGTVSGGGEVIGEEG